MAAAAIDGDSKMAMRAHAAALRGALARSLPVPGQQLVQLMWLLVRPETMRSSTSLR
jgi:hypothetical protein